MERKQTGVENISGEEEVSRGLGTEEAGVCWGRRGQVFGMDVHEDGWGGGERMAREVG